MPKIQPLGIFTDSTNHYRVRFEGKNGLLEYTFSVVWTGDVGVLNCDQREFFFDTHDDPAAKLLLKAIYHDGTADYWTNRLWFAEGLLALEMLDLRTDLHNY